MSVIFKRNQIKNLLINNGINEYKIVGNWIMIKCPFHVETVPSFGINMISGGFNCFGCGIKGKFEELQKKLNLFGIEYENIDSVKQEQYEKKFNNKKNKTILKNYSFYRLGSHTNQTVEKKILFYLNKRKISEAIVKKFNMGYILDVKFKDRVVVPVYNVNGELEWYEGRMITDGKPKYYRSKGVERNRNLFNINEAIKNKDYVILVEGIFDTIRLVEYGYNSVCSFGIHVSMEQLIQLHHFDLVYLCYDGDKAGRRALSNFRQQYNKINYSLSVEFRYIKIPIGYDPDSISIKEFKKNFDASKSITKK